MLTGRICSAKRKKTVCPFAKTFYSTLEKLGQLLFVNALNYNKNMVIQYI